MYAKRASERIAFKWNHVIAQGDLVNHSLIVRSPPKVGVSNDEGMV
jgi:hypothetical protein